MATMYSATSAVTGRKMRGAASTGWKNKISKDAAVLKHLGLQTRRYNPAGGSGALVGRKGFLRTIELFLRTRPVEM